MQDKLIRIAVVDDHRVFAEALASRLGDEPDLEVVGIAGTADEALELFAQHEVDVVALDLGLGGQDGLALASSLRELWPDLQIVVVNAGADDSRIEEAIGIGVRGWVVQQGGIDLLLTAVRGVAHGETHLPAAVMTRILASMSGRRSASPDAEAVALLTVRELEVLRCLVDGMLRIEIGKQLHVSPNTVRSHIQSILHKLNVHSSLAAVAVARRAGVAGLQEELRSPSVTPVQ